MKISPSPVNSLNEFNAYISRNYSSVTPGGFYLGDTNSPATFAYRGNADIALGTLVQNAMNILLSNVTIAAQYRRFDIPWQADGG